ncbi:MAG TPA: PDR/VanB family oxidoreductase [Streptosporangiaceae bacterium]|nr:PDR/VanB family oxidoreductase [Streptosporangiaceae bacterium]
MNGADELPPDLYGRPRADRLIRGLTMFATAYQRLLDRGKDRGLSAAPRAVRADRELVVTSRAAECDEVISLRLAAPDGAPLPRWHPGAHLRIELPSGRARHYSLCGNPADAAGYAIAVRRIDGGGAGAGAGGGSAEVHDALLPGTRVRAVGPRNGFPFGREPVVLFLAGGIGITPLLPMVREAAALGLDWRLVYAGRSRACMPFTDAVTAIDPARTEILADDETGVPDCAALIGRAPHGAAVYCCGPPAMLDGVRAAATAAGREAVRAFRFERFTSPPIVDGRAFTLELRRSGAVLDVPPDRSALDVLRDHDPMTPYSCRQGFCGLCQQRVLHGRVDHRDLRLTDAERAAGDILVCVSRAPEGERLVLDA